MAHLNRVSTHLLALTTSPPIHTSYRTVEERASFSLCSDCPSTHLMPHRRRRAVTGHWRRLYCVFRSSISAICGPSSMLHERTNAQRGHDTPFPATFPPNKGVSPSFTAAPMTAWYSTAAHPRVIYYEEGAGCIGWERRVPGHHRGSTQSNSVEYCARGGKI